MPRTIPFRVVLTHKGVSRKFFTLFQGKKDESLYIHLNRPEGQRWRVPAIEQTDMNQMHLDLDNFKEPDFELFKITFHPSGYIHLTDKQGARYRDGTRGPTFEEMESPYDLCVLIPSLLEHLPEADEKYPKEMVVNLVLPDIIRPIYATLGISVGNVTAPPHRGTLIGVFELPISGDRFFYMVLRSVLDKDGNASTNWPSFPFFLLRTKQ